MIKNWTSVSIQKLIGNGINDPTNAILFCRNGHDYFGNFSLFFEPTVSDCISKKESVVSDPFRQTDIATSLDPDIHGSITYMLTSEVILLFLPPTLNILLSMLPLPEY